MFEFLLKENIVAEPNFNRWRIPFASVAIHLCIGSVYAWSIFNPGLIKIHGVVVSSSEDWTLAQVVWVFSVAIVFLGLSAAIAGRWLESVGPRMVGVVASICWSGGFMVGGVGILLHQLWLLYLGYGVLGGCGLGLGYVSPVSALIRWFPDRRGMAAGLAIMGFGGGAIIAAPLKESLMRTFYRAPQYLGTQEEVAIKTELGRRYADVDGRVREIVIVGLQDASKMAVEGPAGVYVVDTGSTGVAETFFVLGAVYFVVMISAALAYRVPAADWRPAGWSDQIPNSARGLATSADFTIEQAVRTPQFYLLWIMLCFNVAAGIGVLGVAKTMITEIFATALPNTVTADFAATYVLMIGVFNMLGRFLWASASDYLGRQRTYAFFFAAGVVLYLSIPLTAYRMSVAPSGLWLVIYYAVTMLIFTMYGGGFATIPAYLADLFGTRYVGGIHGRLLTAWSVAGVLGPWSITWLRERSIESAIFSLARQVDPERFQEAFGAPISQLESLMKTKAVTISRLMECAKPGTMDPTSTLYSSTMFLMATLLAIALVANYLIRPTHMPDD